MKILKWLFGLLKPGDSPTRRYVKDVEAGEVIQIEWRRIKGGIGYVKCISNDPETKKILLEVKWGQPPRM